MPYKSDAQRRYFNANRAELEAQGVDVDEWNDSSRGKKLPEKVKKKKTKKQAADEHIQQLAKIAVEIVRGERKSKPVHGLLDRMVFGKDQLGVPNSKDLENWQNIADYMEAARPYQLGSAKIMSGRVDPAEFINQIEAHQKHDSWLENVGGTRDMLAQAYANLPPTALEQFPASYHPHANSVLLNEKSPGVLIHELGHGVDMAPRENESNFWRHMRWNWKPTLWNEADAWRKGRKAYQEGYASDPESSKPDADHSKYIENMQSLNERKYPAYGTYLGGTLGGLGGLGLGVLGTLALAKNTGVMAPQIAALGGLLGGLGGVFGGAALGKGWANWRKDAHKARSLKQLQKLHDDPEKLKEVTERLLAIRAKRKSKSKDKDKDKTMPKAANDIQLLAKAAAGEGTEGTRGVIDALNNIGAEEGNAIKSMLGTVLGAGTGGLMGAGGAAGATVGGLKGLFSDPGEDEEGNKKSRLLAALKGGLGGGALGAAGGLAAGAGGLGGSALGGAAGNRLASMFHKKSSVESLAKEAAGRCWEGYEPVPGKEPYSDDSCRPAKKKKSEKEAAINVKDITPGNTAAAGALLGGGLGAGAGGLSALIQKMMKKDDDESEDPSVLNRALLGGIAGGGAGAAGGYLGAPKLQDLAKQVVHSQSFTDGMGEDVADVLGSFRGFRP